MNEANEINIPTVIEEDDRRSAFMCPNGHLYRNQSPMRRAELRSKGLEPQSLVNDGDTCRSCGEAIASLTADVTELQDKLSMNMLNARALQLQSIDLQKVNLQANAIALYMRGAYEREIYLGAPQHNKDLATAVIFYLSRERRRPMILLRNIGLRILRLLGV